MTKIWAKTDIKRSFFARRAKKGLGRSSPQELEEGLRSGPHILVLDNRRNKMVLTLLIQALLTESITNTSLIEREKLSWSD